MYLAMKINNSIIITGLPRSSHWYNSVGNIKRIVNNILTGLGTCSTCLEVIGLRGEHVIMILLNGYSLKVPHEYLHPHYSSKKLYAVNGS